MIKRIILLLSFALLATVRGNPGEAAFVPHPGEAPYREIVTAEMAKTLPDDVDVTLQGNIVSHIRKEYYVFRDDTGTITVEIDDDVWRGLVVGPDDKVEIGGEIDRDFNSLKVEADYVKKLESQ